ncbi:unnamed protein product, partial [Allacma fusca]
TIISSHLYSGTNGELLTVNSSYQHIPYIRVLIFSIPWIFLLSDSEVSTSGASVTHH